MRYLLFVGIVLLVVWLWRSNRPRVDSGSEPAPGRSAGPTAQQEMVRCPVCSVHIPRSDALPGPDGQLYCCAEHRARGGA